MTKNIFILSIVLIISCGKSPEEKSHDDVENDANIDGTYSAILFPVNEKISGNVHGDVKISKYSDDFKVYVDLKKAPRGRFRQHLHTGTACPKMNQDLNGDGIIDAYEAREHTGSIIVPLDGDLSAQGSGSSYTLQGNYRYTKSTSYFLMLSDLHLPDDVINDPVVKLPDKDLPLEKRVVAVYSSGAGLPLTVAGEVPIACGVLTRISDRPEPSDDDLDDGWEENPRPRRPPRHEPNPSPRPDPVPLPLPEPEVGEDNHSEGSWWDRLRQRWRRWRNRWGENDDEG